MGTFTEALNEPNISSKKLEVGHMETTASFGFANRKIFPQENRVYIIDIL